MQELLLTECSCLPFYKAQLPPSFCFSPLSDLHISEEAVLSVRNYATQLVQLLDSIG